MGGGAGVRQTRPRLRPAGASWSRSEHDCGRSQTRSYSRRNGSAAQHRLTESPGKTSGAKRDPRGRGPGGGEGVRQTRLGWRSWTSRRREAGTTSATRQPDRNQPSTPPWRIDRAVPGDRDGRGQWGSKRAGGGRDHRECRARRPRSRPRTHRCRESPGNMLWPSSFNRRRLRSRGRRGPVPVSQPPRAFHEERLQKRGSHARICLTHSTDRSTMWDGSRARQRWESHGLPEGLPDGAGTNMLTTTIARGAGPHLVAAPARSGWLVAFVTTDGRAWCMNPRARRSFEG
jgi:hypothetical protein